MPRTARIAPAGMIFHVLNRANGRSTIFYKPEDYLAFEKALADTLRHIPIDLFSYCLLPTHWHLVLRPRHSGDLGRFMQRLTVTHVRRWHEHRHSTGRGHLYQGTYKSFPIQEDEHLLTVCRYIERNPLRAKMVKSAQEWNWCSLAARQSRDPDRLALLADWPVDRPRNWSRSVNQPQTPAEEAALQTSIRRGRPYGEEAWQERTSRRLNLQSSLRPRGRPRNKPLTISETARKQGE